MNKILIVDDDELHCSMLREILEDYPAVLAKNGKEALSIFKNSKEINLIVSDYKMPEMNGLDFLREVRRVAPQLPFILVTGFGESKVLIEAKELKLDLFLEKPVEALKLIQKVEELLNR